MASETGPIQGWAIQLLEPYVVRATRAGALNGLALQDIELRAGGLMRYLTACESGEIPRRKKKPYERSAPQRFRHFVGEQHDQLLYRLK